MIDTNSTPTQQETLEPLDRIQATICKSCNTARLHETRCRACGGKLFFEDEVEYVRAAVAGPRGDEDRQLAEQLRGLLASAFITGHSHGPSSDYQVQLKFRTLKESQQCHTLIEAITHPEYRESFIKQGVLASFAAPPAPAESASSTQACCLDCGHGEGTDEAGRCRFMFVASDPSQVVDTSPTNQCSHYCPRSIGERIARVH